MCENGVSSTSTHCETDCWHTSPAAMKSQPTSQPAGVRGIKAEPVDDCDCETGDSFQPVSQPAGVRSIKAEPVDDCDCETGDSFQPVSQPAGVRSIKAEPVDDCDCETGDSFQPVSQPAGVRSIKAEPANDSETDDVSHQIQSADNTSREVKVDTKLKGCNCCDFPPSPPDTGRDVVKSEDCKSSKDSKDSIKSESPAFTPLSPTSDPATTASSEVKCEDVNPHRRSEMTTDGQTTAHSTSDGQPSVDHNRSEMTSDRQTTAHSTSDGSAAENVSSSSVQLMTEKKGRPLSSSTDRTSLHTSAITAGPLVMLNRCHVCQRCSDAFVLLSSWKQHMASAHGEKIHHVSAESSTQSADSREKKGTSARTHQPSSSHRTRHKTKSNTSASQLPRNRSHVCQHCSAAFVLFNSLKLHAASVHGETLQVSLPVTSTPGRCDIGNRTNKLDAKERVGNHGDGNNVVNSVQDAKTMEQKKDTVGGRKTVKSVKVKVDDIDTDMTDLKKKARRHVCDMCSKAFTDACSLKIHMMVHSGLKPFVCNVCGKAFSQTGSLTKHKRTHTGERPYKCPHCDADFNISGNLQRHIRAVHAGDRPYVCQVCGAAFSLSSHLQQHKMTHTGEKPHECTVCGKRFTQKGHLHTHAVVHTGKKPHTCPHCPAAFTLSDNLKTHIQKFHQ